VASFSKVSLSSKVLALRFLHLVFVSFCPLFLRLLLLAFFLLFVFVLLFCLGSFGLLHVF